MGMKCQRYNIRMKLARWAIRVIRYKEGSRWDMLRAGCYKQLMESVGNDIKIRSGVIIKDPQHIRMGSRISIQENCYLSGFGGLTIGNDVSIGTGTYIFTSTHPLTGAIIRNNTLEKRPVVLGNNIWLGAGVRIMGGVTIGNHVAVGAGAVVTKDLPSRGVYAGVPAMKLRDLPYDNFMD